MGVGLVMLIKIVSVPCYPTVVAVWAERCHSRQWWVISIGCDYWLIRQISRAVQTGYTYTLPLIIAVTIEHNLSIY